MTVNQLFCPCIGALAITILAYFAWSLCRIAALSDKAIEAMKRAGAAND